jgi:hypothetical protein
MQSSNHLRSTGLYTNNNTNFINQSGIGILSDIQDVSDKIFKLRPKILNDLILDKGNLIIKSIDVCRVPIRDIWQKFINVLSFGQIKRNMKAKGFDKLYHMYLQFNLSDGTIWSVEKNQRVNVIKGSKSTRPGSECRNMIYGKKTLEDFLLTTEKANIKNFYSYDPFLNNCQRWITSLLNTNGVHILDDFVAQDIEKLAPSYIKFISVPVLGLAAVLDFIQRGGHDKDE